MSAQFLTSSGPWGSYGAMQIDGEIDGLTQQWIDRHAATRIQFRAARIDGKELMQLTEFDDVMDFHDEAHARMRTVVEYRVDLDNRAAIAEGTAIDAVLSGYRQGWQIGRRNWLIARGYTNVPELTKEPEPLGELDYDWG
jgi:hypothetical protein